MAKGLKFSLRQTCVHMFRVPCLTLCDLEQITEPAWSSVPTTLRGSRQSLSPGTGKMGKKISPQYLADDATKAWMVPFHASCMELLTCTYCPPISLQDGHSLSTKAGVHASELPGAPASQNVKGLVSIFLAAPHIPLARLLQPHLGASDNSDLSLERSPSSPSSECSKQGGRMLLQGSTFKGGRTFLLRQRT